MSKFDVQEEIRNLEEIWNAIAVETCHRERKNKSAVLDNIAFTKQYLSSPGRHKIEQEIVVAQETVIATEEYAALQAAKIVVMEQFRRLKAISISAANLAAIQLKLISADILKASDGGIKVSHAKLLKTYNAQRKELGGDALQSMISMDTANFDMLNAARTYAGIVWMQTNMRARAGGKAPII